ncbi:CAAX amino terminal protease [Vigna unguiculata]|uniref:CAAX amino terminal protease n=1 Tax=Vigna unguiculata TaxID=3917 RepID=A0A4D6LBZ5_VIGUN|nr:CAAX amino terminal protease [Vigna unguiculata]
MAYSEAMGGALGMANSFIDLPCFFVLTGLTEVIALPYLGIQPDVLSLDDKAEILLLDQGITTAVVLGIIYSVANTFQPLPEDFFKYDLREPFNLQKGWLLWAGVGLVSAIIAIALTGVAVSFFSGETPQRETDALVRLLPLIGSSNLSTACLVGITGVLAPLLEETVFRGFFMTSLTKWVPTPVAVVISASVFALAHLTPGEFPQLFVLGVYHNSMFANSVSYYHQLLLNNKNASSAVSVCSFKGMISENCCRQLDGSILFLSWM